METTLIYFSVKAMSATYILYKVWMFKYSLLSILKKKKEPNG